MFEQETDELIRILFHRVGEGRSTIAVKHILAANIPSPIKTFFRADVEAMLLEEQNQARTTSRFNHDHPEVLGLQNQINSVLVLHYSYPESVFHDRLTDGVHLLINYLARPQWTLVESVFEKKNSISTPALDALLQYYEPYDYLKHLLHHYLVTKKIQAIDRGTFSTLLWKLDGEYIRRKDGDQIARLLIPFFDMINFLRIREEPTLPVNVLEKYFEDKGLIPVVTMLEGTLAQGKESLTNRELADLLEDIRRASGAFVVEPRESEPAPFSSYRPIQEKISSPSEELSTPAGITITLDEADRRRFIKKIFKQDPDAFARAIETLQHLPHWKDASRAIDEIFISQVIDPYSSDAIRFLEVLYRQYHPT
jgi:hypothetical protein